MIQRLRSLPVDQIERRFDSRGVRLEAGLVLLYGILASIGMIYFAWKFWGITGNQPAYTEYHLTGEILGPILFTFGVWIWYTVVTHFIANLYGGRGPIVRLFRTSAWAMLPIGLWFLLRSIVQAVLFYTADFPEDGGALSDLGLGIEEQMEAVVEMGLEDPIYVVTLLVGVLFVAWSWRYLTVAVQQTKDLSADEARKVALVPTGTFAIYVLYLAFQWQPFV